MDLRIRNLNDAVVRELKDQAKRLGKGWQGFLHDALTDVALRPRRELAARLREQHAAMRAEFGVLRDSTPGIRAERDGLNE